MRAPQRLTDIDIAEASDDLLVQQGAFQGLAFALKPARQIIRAQRIACRLRAKLGKGRVKIELVALHQMHEAEAARIIIDDADTLFSLIEMKDDMVVLAVLRAGVMKRAGRLVSLIRFRLDTKRTGHAEMGNDRQPVFQLDEKIFRPSSERYDRLALDQPREILRERKAQIRAARCSLRTLAPSIAGARPRLTVSTSGNSGIWLIRQFIVRTMWSIQCTRNVAPRRCGNR